MLWLLLPAVTLASALSTAQPAPTNTTQTTPSPSGLPIGSQPSTANASANTFTDVFYQLPSSFAVLPLPFASRNFSQPFAPAAYINGSSVEGTTIGGASPHFQVYNEELAKDIIGEQPSIRVLMYEEGYAFAHEAPVYFPDTDDLYFCSDAGGALGRSNNSVNNVVWKLNVGSILSKLDSGGNATLAEDVKALNISSDGVQMTNGGTNYNGSLLLANSGRDIYPGTLALISRSEISNQTSSTVLLNNAYGKQFNAPNDVVVHPSSGAIFFTDADYAELQGFRPGGQLPRQTWRFDPTSGQLTVLDDSVTVPNGLVLSPDGKTLYISDTGAARGGPVPNNYNTSTTIYAWDVVDSDGMQSLANKRILTWTDTGIADGLKVDSKGNVYAGTGDGVAVFTSTGRPILKIFLPQGAVNLVFAGPGRLLITAQEYIWSVSLSQSAQGAPLDTYPTV